MPACGDRAKLDGRRAVFSGFTRSAEAIRIVGAALKEPLIRKALALIILTKIRASCYAKCSKHWQGQ